MMSDIPSVRVEPVETLPFFCVDAEEQGFDRLSPSGF
jgi:hypothetical protein